MDQFLYEFNNSYQGDMQYVQAQYEQTINHRYFAKKFSGITLCRPILTLLTQLRMTFIRIINYMKTRSTF